MGRVALLGTEYTMTRDFFAAALREAGVDVVVPSRDALAAATGLWEAVGREGAGLEGRGRVLVRPSGTEPLVRVMVEAPDEAECEQVLGRLVAVAHRELG